MPRAIDRNISMRRKWYGIARENLWTFGLALVLALIVKTSIVEAYIIPSGSMENTLYAGDHILGNKFVYGMKLPVPFIDIRLPAICEPKPGDVIIFSYPIQPDVCYIKRCIAVEGQVVQIRDKQVYVDGRLSDLPSTGKYVDDTIIAGRQFRGWGLPVRDNMPAVRVPEGMLFVMGDNRDNSADSRFWGFLPRNLVLGRALIVFWSWEFTEPLPMAANGAFSNFDLWLYNIRNFPSLVQKIRWERLGEIIN